MRKGCQSNDYVSTLRSLRKRRGKEDKKKKRKKEEEEKDKGGGNRKKGRGIKNKMNRKKSKAKRTWATACCRNAISILDSARSAHYWLWVTPVMCLS